MKSFACGQVVPGCEATFTGETDAEILGQVGAHAADAHQMPDVPPEVVEQVRAHLRTTAS